MQLRSLAALACASLLGFAMPAHATAPAEEAPAVKEAPSVPSRETMLSPLQTDIVLGDANAPVTIIEYASLSCSHCAHFHGETFPQIKKDYIDTGKAAFIFRDFPFNEPALRGAMLARCAAGEEQDAKRHQSFLKALFSTQDKWAFDQNFRTSLKQLASVGGMSEEDFEACLADKKLEDTIVQGLKWGAEGLNVQSTPTLFINGTVVEGSQPYDKIKAIIDPLLQ